MQVNGRAIVLVALLAVLTGIVIYEWRQTGAAPSSAAAVVGTPAGATASGRRAAPAAAAVPAVRLDRLDAARAEPAPPASERNPFVFQPKAPPPPTPAQLRQLAQMQAAAAPPVPTGPPPPPPITLKFIGIVQAPDRKLAVLTDSATKDVFYGREGDIIDGRYRILRIGVESVEMQYVDGRGRQTLRLTGSS